MSDVPQPPSKDAASGNGSQNTKPEPQPTLSVKANVEPTPPAATAQQLQVTETRIEERMSAFERSMLRLTLFGLVITLLTGLVFVGQLYEMKEGGRQTDKLVGFAKSQSDASTQIATASQNFVTTASNAVADFQAAAKQSNEAANKAADNTGMSVRNALEASRNDQRAWVAATGLSMDAPEVGKTMHGYVVWSNSGKTYAKKVESSVHYIFVQNPIPDETALKKIPTSGSIQPASIGVLAPNSQYKTALETTVVGEIDKERIGGSWYTYIWGELSYDDIFQHTHSVMFCSLRQGATGDFDQCPFHNDAN